MIKWIRFVERPGDATGLAGAPRAVRPERVVACTTLPELTDAGVPYGGIEIAWFRDPAAVAGFRAWAGHGVVVVADEVVLRGADWLERRWADGGPRLKQVAVARRAAGLTPEEFSARWRDHAGRGASGTAIPERLRGNAYVQNHPRLPGEWPYDAVNEVYVENVAALRERTAWLRRNTATDGLFRDTALIAVAETPR